MKDLRKEYGRLTLEEDSTGMDPLALFKEWFEAARETEEDANAMTLATVNAAGQPDARIVLLKDARESGFVFFTNYDSSKGKDMARNPVAALCFYWKHLERQVRVRGPVSMVDESESEDYFHSRPLESRYGALASAQSQEVLSRAVLEEQMAKLQEKHGDQPPRPGNWGGYIVQPNEIEFWQGRPGRVHDRLLYKRKGNIWNRVRLSP